MTTTENHGDDMEKEWRSLWLMTRRLVTAKKMESSDWEGKESTSFALATGSCDETTKQNAIVRSCVFGR